MKLYICICIYVYEFVYVFVYVYVHVSMCICIYNPHLGPSWAEPLVVPLLVLWTFLGRTLVGVPELFWAQHLSSPMGSCGPTPCWHPGHCVQGSCGRPWAYVGQALVGSHGPRWARPLLAAMSLYGPGPHDLRGSFWARPLWSSSGSLWAGLLWALLGPYVHCRTFRRAEYSQIPNDNK